MAEVRVTCPMCNAELAIGEEHLGKEIECGSCLQAFVAEDPKTKKKPYKMRRDERDDDDDDRPRRKKRRRRDDDDDYDYSPPNSSEGGGVGLGVTSLILGIISIPPAVMCCCPVVSSLVAGTLQLGGLTCGALGLRSPSGRGIAIAGLIVNGLGLAVTILAAAFWVAPQGWQFMK